MASPVLINRRTTLLLVVFGGVIVPIGIFALIATAHTMEIICTDGPADPMTSHRDSAAVTYGPFFEVDGLVLQLPEGPGQLSLVVGMEVASDQVVHPTHEMYAREAQVRQAITRILLSRSNEELASLAHRNALKAELLAATNEILEETHIRRLYFTRYILD